VPDSGPNPQSGAADPQRTGLSLVLIAPDVWSPIITSAEEALSLGEVLYDSILREFYERRPDRKYLTETLLLDRAAFSAAGLEEWTIAESLIDSLNTRTADSAAESLVVEDAGLDALNSGWGVVTSQVSRMAITEARLASYGSVEDRAEQRYITESVISKLAGSPEASSEILEPLEIVAEIENLWSVSSEELPVIEELVVQWAVSNSRSEALNYYEWGSDYIRRINEEVLAEFLGATESRTDNARLINARTEALSFIEVKADYVSVLRDLVEIFILAESRNDTAAISDPLTELLSSVFGESSRDNYSSIGQNNLTEYPVFTEVAVTLGTFVVPRSEVVSLGESLVSRLNLGVPLTEQPVVQEAITSRVNFSAPASESVAVSESRVDSLRHNFSESRTEPWSVSESRTDSAVWQGLQTESISVLESRQDSVTIVGNVTESRSENIASTWTETAVTSLGLPSAGSELLDLSYPRSSSSVDSLFELLRLSSDSPLALTPAQLAELNLEENPMPGNAVTMTAVSVSTSAVRADTVALSGRIRVRVTNNGSQPVYVGHNNQVSASTGDPIDPQGGMWEQYWTEAVQVWLLSSGGTQSCVITQVAVQ
jgi:hypothetical protein